MKHDAEKQKRKAFYRKCAASSKRQRLDGDHPDKKTTPKNLQPGMIGYLVTCNQHERLAVMESFRLLNDALKRVLPVPSSDQEQPDTKQDSELHTNQIVQTNDESDDDILSQLRMENSSVSETVFCETETQNQQNQPRYSFYSVRSGVSNCVFILHYSESVNPNTLVNSIFEYSLKNQLVESRHVLRFLPVAATCHASAPELNRCVRLLWTAFLGRPNDGVKTSDPADPSEQPKQTATDINTSAPDGGIRDGSVESTGAEKSKYTEDKHVHCASISSLCPRVPAAQAQPKTIDGPKTFLVSFKARNYDRLSRDVAITSTVSAVCDVDPSWRICPVDPSVMIFVNVLRNVACISILEDFTRFRKYNLAELIPSANEPKLEQQNVAQKDE